MDYNKAIPSEMKSIIRSQNELRADGDRYSIIQSRFNITCSAILSCLHDFILCLMLQSSTSLQRTSKHLTCRNKYRKLCQDVLIADTLITAILDINDTAKELGADVSISFFLFLIFCFNKNKN